MRSRLVLRSLGIGLLFLMAGCTPKAKPVDPNANPLVGAWRSNVQFGDGAFASVKNLEFLYTFNAGGTMTESSNYDAVPPVPPAYGVWRMVGINRFEAKYVFYITKAPTRFDDLAQGGGWTPTGHGELTESLTLAVDGQSFESTINYEAFDSTGKSVAGGGKATGRGTRIGF